MTTRDLYLEILTAWNERDADRYAAAFAADALIVGFDGSQVAGADIAGHLGPIFTDHPTAAYVAKVVAVREVGGGAELVHAIAGLVPPGSNQITPALNAVQSLLVADGRALLFQNTPAQYHGRPDLTEQHTAELQALLANGTVLG
ncbi:SgcJ/EcaC family oxidoreductase [Actinoplanes sp. NPDC023714]|uniref:SgcJ/EcaC family oxidoreductase n=1 Tax=Actinoplanes sp. NPDC023714 TaxID=3154322 RepID=UPI0033EFFA75